MTILALDIASKTGWAKYGPGMDRPFSGSEIISKAQWPLGRAMKRLRDLVREQHQLTPLSGIVYEAQHVSDKINPQTLYMLIGGGVLVEEIAYMLKIPVHSCDISTWRKHFLGIGSFRNKKLPGGKIITGRSQAKSRSIDACATYGWYPADDNAADALGILDYYLSIMPASRQMPQPWRDAAFMAGLAR